MAAMSKITQLTDGCFWATWAAGAKCCEAARKIWCGPDLAVENIVTPQPNTSGPVTEAIDQEKRLQLLFSAGF